MPKWPRTWGRSIAVRLLLFAGVWALVMLATGAIVLSGLYRSTVYRDVQDRLDADTLAVLSGISIDADGVATVSSAPTDAAYGRTFSGRYWAVYDAERLARETGDAPVAASRSLYDEALAFDRAALAAVTPGADRPATLLGVGPSDERIHARARAFTLGDGGRRLIVVAATAKAPIEASVAAFRSRVALGLALFALILISGLLALLRLALGPVLRLRQQVAEVRDGVRQRLPSGEAPTELEPLSEEINALLDQNRDIVERARSHVGNLAHALKTPVTILLNEARGLDGVLPDVVRRQAEAMRGQVEHHLRRASAVARAQGAAARTEVRAVVEDLARTLPRLHRDKSVQLEVRQGPPDLQFRGERQDLEEVVGNLLDNAFKWSGGRVLCAVERLDGAGRFAIRVEDDGPGLPPERRAEVLRRGVRLDEAAPGSGLGLGIVDDLARAYGGSLELGTSALGGLAVRVELPAVGPRASRR